MDRVRVTSASAIARTALGVALVVVVASLSSCAATSTTERTGSVVWHDCGDIECATLSVPLDWAHPGGRHIGLSLARRPADGRRVGVLLTNPGGPGGSGVELVQDAGDAFDTTVRDRFDIVSWDPRGVGASAPANCASRLDFFYAVDRNGTDAATARANAAVSRRLVASCEQSAGRLLPYLSTDATVRDMDAIRAAIGVPTVDYLGFSYGTYIGALYADRYPAHVRAMVLDGAVDPAASYDDGTLSQAVGFDHALDAFFAWCRGDSHCAFARGADPRAAFADLFASLAGESDPAKVHGERRSLGVGEAGIGVATALYAGRDGWPRSARRSTTRHGVTGADSSRSPTPTRGDRPAAPTTTRRPRSTRSAASTARRRGRSPRRSNSRRARRVPRRSSGPPRCGWVCRARTGRCRRSAGRLRSGRPPRRRSSSSATPTIPRRRTRRRRRSPAR